MIPLQRKLRQLRSWQGKTLRQVAYPQRDSLFVDLETGNPATLQAQMAANAAAFRRASMTQGNNNQRNNFNPAAAGIGQPMQTGLAGIPTPGALYSGGAATLAPSSNWQRQPYNPWAGGPRPALRMQ